MNLALLFGQHVESVSDLLSGFARNAKQTVLDHFEIVVTDFRPCLHQLVFWLGKWHIYLGLILLQHILVKEVLCIDQIHLLDQLARQVVLVVQITLNIRVVIVNVQGICLNSRLGRFRCSFLDDCLFG